MARNGSGSMSIPYSDFVSNTTIASSQIDDNFATIVAEITNSMPRDGQAAPTANLPMGSYKLTGLGAGSAATDSANLGQVAANAYVWCGTAGGTADALTLTPTPTHTTYAAGKIFRFIAGGTNTGAATVNVSAIGVKTIQNNGAALSAGMIEIGKLYEIIYDGTQFQLAQYLTPAKIFAPLASPTFTGTVALPTTTIAGDVTVNTNKLAITASTGQTAIGFAGNATQGILQAYQISGGTPEASGSTDANQVVALNASTVQLRYGAFAGGQGWLQMSSAANYATNYALTLNPNGGSVTVGAAEVVSQGRLQVSNSSIGGGAPAASGTADTNQIAAFRAGNRQLRVGVTASGTFWLQNSAPGDYSTNGNLSLNPNGGFIQAQPVYDNTTASAANVNVDSSGILQRSTSSLKYKKDVADYTSGLTAVLSLRPVFYKSKHDQDAHRYAGLIAEEVHSVGLTEFVQYDDDGSPDALAYGNMIALAFKAIQELKAENDDLRTRLTALEGA